MKDNVFKTCVGVILSPFTSFNIISSRVFLKPSFRLNFSPAMSLEKLVPNIKKNHNPNII